MIEDCAHSIGAYWKGQHSGTYGDLGCFSFQQGKHMTTGDGGMMTMNRQIYTKNCLRSGPLASRPVS